MSETAARLEIQVDSRPAATGVTAATRELDRLKDAARGAQGEIDALSKSGGRIGQAGAGAGVAAAEINRLSGAAKAGETSMGGLSGAIKRAANDNTLLGAAARGLIAGLREAANETDRARDSLGRYTAANDNADSSLVRLGGRMRLLPGLILGVSFAALAKGIVDTVSEFQSLQARLEVATGSIDGAKEAFAALQTLAAKTPFSVAELTTAFINLRNLGLDPSEAALISYGNTAGAMGKTLDQFIQAVADAATGQFERLKEFGIKASAEGDKVAFTFKGVTTSVANDARSIETYLQGIGNTDFASGMDKQAATLNGAFSNLGDGVSTLASQFGAGGFSAALLDTVKSLSETAGGADELAAELGGLAGDALTAAADIVRSFDFTSDSAADTVREIRANFAGLGAALSAAFNPLLVAAEFVFGKIEDDSLTLADRIRPLFSEIDAIGNFANRVFNTGRVSNLAGKFDAGVEAKNVELLNAKQERDLEALLQAEEASRNRTDPLAKYRSGATAGAGAGGASAASKAASEAKQAANEAARAAKELDSTYERLTGRYDKVGDAARDYAKELADIVRLQNAGRIGLAEADLLSGGARQRKLDAQVGPRAGVSFVDSPLTASLDSQVSENQAKRDFDQLARETGETMARAFGDTSLQFAAGIGELIGGKAGTALGGLIRSLNTPGGAITGQALGGRLGGAFNALDAITGGGTDPGKASPLAKSFTAGLDKAFSPLKDVLGSVKGGLDKIFSSEGGAAGFAGKALAGAAVGGVVNGVLGGSKNAQLGGQIGGAAGQFLPIPGGAIIGAIAGNLLGGLIKKDPYSDATATVNSSGKLSFGGIKTRGDGSDEKLQGLTDSLSAVFENLVNGLGVKLNAGNVGGIGTNKDNFYFNPTTGNFKAAGTQVFKTAEEAVFAAMKNAITKGIVTGISEGAKRLLLAGGDIEAQIGKASKFENVFKELRQRQDPVGAAIEELNKQLTELRGIFAEAGASTADYAKLEELFQLKRKDVLEQGNSAALDTMKQYLDQLKGASQYGLSAETRYASSQAQLAQLDATRASGGAVDFAKYQTTADTFLQASRDLNGSTTSYFRDLEAVTNTVQALVDKGQAEADKAAANQPVVDAITAQTSATVSALDAVRAAVEKINGGASNDNTVSGRVGDTLARYYLNF